MLTVRNKMQKISVHRLLKVIEIIDFIFHVFSLQPFGIDMYLEIILCYNCVNNILDVIFNFKLVGILILSLSTFFIINIPYKIFN